MPFRGLSGKAKKHSGDDHGHNHIHRNYDGCDRN